MATKALRKLTANHANYFCVSSANKVCSLSNTFSCFRLSIRNFPFFSVSNHQMRRKGRDRGKEKMIGISLRPRGSKWERKTKISGIDSWSVVGKNNSIVRQRIMSELENIVPDDCPLFLCNFWIPFSCKSLTFPKYPLFIFNCFPSLSVCIKMP